MPHDAVLRNCRHLLCSVAALFLVAAGSLAVFAADPGQSNAADVAAASFDREVRPILAKHCVECHSGTDAELGLLLSSATDVLTGSKRGPVVTPGKAAESLLLQVMSEDADPHMPPDGQLSEAEVAVVTRWIDALDATTTIGTPKVTEQDRSHWSFRPVERPATPTVVDSAWARTPIDQFILAKLDEVGIEPSAEADRPTLLRRLYLDLIGLPPSPDEVAEFISDEAPDAYERVVERLLASPRYGERWGRHWLDLARYADSAGFHNDLDRPNAWRYRDYVIASFNNDKPYAHFIREQLAGDELPDPTLENWIATGFGRNGPSNDDNMGMGLEREKYRLDELDGVISTTSNVFLGLTLGCARCHDHKYDPLSQRDYYRFLAYFNNAENKQLELSSFRPEVPTLLAADPKSRTAATVMVLTDRDAKPRTTRVLWRGDVRSPGPIVEAGVPEVFSTELSSSASLAPPSHRLALADWIADDDNPLTWRVMVNRIWQHHFGRGLVSTPSNFGRLGESPTHPELLDWLADELRRSGGSTKSLHRLIVTSAVYRQSSNATGSGQAIDPDNRLLWRMNKRRLEAEPLRDAFLTVSGNLNLAIGGAGVKPRIRPDLLVASQRNKWPVVEREAAEHWRRSVYVYVKRQLQLPLMELFDAPSTAHSCAQREESLVPTQALVLMNDEFVREQALFFADRVRHEVGDDRAAQVERALLIALCRSPDKDRINDGVAFLTSQTDRLQNEGESLDLARREALADLCHVIMNLSEFVYVD